MKKKAVRKKKLSAKEIAKQKLEAKIIELQSRIENLETARLQARQRYENAQTELNHLLSKQGEAMAENSRLQSLTFQYDVAKRLPAIDAVNAQVGQLVRNLVTHLAVRRAQHNVPYLLMMTEQTFRKLSDVDWHPHANFERIPIALSGTIRDDQILILGKPKHGWGNIMRLERSESYPQLMGTRK